VIPSTVNSAGHPWLSQPLPAPPPLAAWRPQNITYSGRTPDATGSSNSLVLHACAAVTTRQHSHQHPPQRAREIPGAESRSTTTPSANPAGSPASSANLDRIKTRSQNVSRHHSFVAPTAESVPGF
jgi:hypothetical protein